MVWRWRWVSASAKATPSEEMVLSMATARGVTRGLTSLVVPVGSSSAWSRCSGVSK